MKTFVCGLCHTKLRNVVAGWAYFYSSIGIYCANTNQASEFNFRKHLKSFFSSVVRAIKLVLANTTAAPLFRSTCPYVIFFHTNCCQHKSQSHINSLLLNSPSDKRYLFTNLTTVYPLGRTLVCIEGVESNPTSSGCACIRLCGF